MPAILIKISEDYKQFKQHSHNYKSQVILNLPIPIWEKQK